MMGILDLFGRLPRYLWIYATQKRMNWFEDGQLAACRYPRDEKALRELAEHGVSTLVNLHQRPHTSETLAQFGMTQFHLPVPDFTAPTSAQLADGVCAIEQAIGAGTKVAVHCGAGQGRTGTLIACYLISKGLSADEAIAHVRAVRPGSVETRQQELAVQAYAHRIGRDELNR